MNDWKFSVILDIFLIVNESQHQPDHQNFEKFSAINFFRIMFVCGFRGNLTLIPLRYVGYVFH